MEEITEQVQEATTVGDNAEENSFGQFKTKEGLMDAYKSLQAEFTRRSQRLKDLEAEVSRQTEAQKWDSKVSELIQAFPIAGELSGEIKDYLGAHKELVKDDNCLQTALLGVLAERALTEKTSPKAHAREAEREVAPKAEQTEESLPERYSFGEVPTNNAERYAKIHEYMHKLEGNPQKVPPVMGEQGGETPLGIPSKPTDFRSAREIAKLFLKVNNQ